MNDPAMGRGGEFNQILPPMPESRLSWFDLQIRWLGKRWSDTSGATQRLACAAGFIWRAALCLPALRSEVLHSHLLQGAITIIFVGPLTIHSVAPNVHVILSAANPMSRLRSELTTKTPGLISLALLLLGGLGFWVVGGSVSGVGETPGLFAEDGHVTFAPPGDQSGVLKRTAERPPVGDDDGSPWLAGRAPCLPLTFLSESFPADAVHEFYSGAAPYLPQIPRAPPVA